MVKYNCNFETCPIGIVPFGTGNDFARVLGNLSMILIKSQISIIHFTVTYAKIY